MIVAGVGCRRGCSGAEIAGLVRDALAGRQAAALAAPAFKQDEAGLHEAARLLGLGLRLVREPALAAAQNGCMTRSARVRQATGLASVAEASALAVAGSGSRLILPRIASARATCALAEARRA